MNIPSTTTTRLTVLFLMAGLPMAAIAQQSAPPRTLQAPTSPPETIVVVTPPAEEEEEPGAEGARAIPLKEGLKQLRRLRLKNFGQIRNTEIRQLGIAKLREYNESKFYPHLLEIFAHEDKDVRGAILDLLADQKDERADTTIAYGAIFDKSEWFRKEAAKRLVRRADEYRAERVGLASSGAAPLATPRGAQGGDKAPPPGTDSGLHWRVKAVIANGLKQKDNDVVATAANLAADLKLFDLIPALINAQVQGPTGTVAGVNGGGGETGALAYILVGTQQAFVSDLEPVVGDSAVGFDPEMSVATEGVVLRVIDAAVITYRTEVHYSLRRLAESGWDGRRTDGFKFDPRAWQRWYADEFLPYRKAVAAGAVSEGEPLPPP